MYTDQTNGKDETMPAAPQQTAPEQLTTGHETFAQTTASQPAQKQPALQIVLPKINILCMPKSGTAYTSKTLAAGLSIPVLDSSIGIFPDKVINLSGGWDKFLNENCLHCSDVSYNEFHRYIFERSMGKTVLHFRDPRPALLSWIHYLDNRTLPHIELHRGELPGTNPYLSYIDAVFERYMSEDWDSLDMERKIDLNIDTFYIESLQWLSGWLDGIELFRNVEFLITQHQELKDDEKAFFNKILDFYEIPRERFVHPHLTKAMDTVNYRKGSNVEWVEVFSAQQRKRVTEMLPAEWMRQFGWGS